MATYKFLYNNISFYIMMLFLVACALLGGSSKPEVFQLVIIRPLSVLVLVILLLLPQPIAARQLRIPAIILAVFAATISLQLVPLPPDLWARLPGRHRYSAAAALLGGDAPWRPISLTPDLTLNSLMALIPAAITLLAVSRMNVEQRRWTVSATIVVAIASALLGLIQLAAGTDSSAYLFGPKPDPLPVGFFANRNHQALLLSIALPALLFTGTYQRMRTGRVSALDALAAAAAIVLVATIIVGGSRAGTFLAFLGLVMGMLLIAGRAGYLGADSRWLRLSALAVLVGPIAILIAALATGRASSIDRLINDHPDRVETRASVTPVLLKITADHMPFGIGYGAFDSVFRGYETDAMLEPTYFNRAHNDVLELLMSGGVFALLTMLAFASWLVSQAREALSPAASARESIGLRRLGFIVTTMIILASLVDYPVRTPLMTVFFALACCWLCDRGADQFRMR